MKKINIRGVLLLICCAVFVFAAVNVVITIVRYNKAATVYEEIQDKYVKTPESTTTEEKKEPDTTEGATTEEPAKEPLPIEVDFDALLRDNKDIVGWIYCPDTPINYPVVQASDNDYYLRRDLNGKYLISGTLFADYRSETVGVDKNYVVFGHNMKNDTMFGTLVDYKKQSYYEAHPMLYYFTPDKAYKIELCAGQVVNRQDEIYNVNVSDEKTSELIEKAISKSTFKAKVEIGEDDRFITLSTCSYEYDNARYILIGKLTPIE